MKVELSRCGMDFDDLYNAKYIIVNGLLWGILCIFLYQGQLPQTNKRFVASQQSYSVASLKQWQNSPVESKIKPEEQERALREEQLEIARYLLAIFPDDANSSFLMGMTYLEQDNVIEAVGHLKRSLELQPDRADAYDHLGRIALIKGEYDKAVVLFRKALANDPRFHSTHYRTARALLFLGKHREAVSELQKDIELFPKASESFCLLGETYLQLKDYLKAKASYETAIRIQPNHLKAHYGLATVCARLRLKDEAKKYRKKFKELEAEDRKAGRHWRQVYDPLKITCESVAHTCTDIGRVYQTHGYTYRAEQLWQKAATIDPNNLVCRFELATLYQQSQRFADALRLYEQITKIDPKNGISYFLIGNLNSRLNRFNTAEKAFKKVIEVAPKRSEGYRGLAELYLKFNRNHMQTKALAAKAVELEPAAMNYFVLAVACDKNGDHAGSLLAAKKATELDPDNVRYKRMYQLIQERK